MRADRARVPAICLAVAAVLAPPVLAPPAAAQGRPQSAIPWLSDSLADRPSGSVPGRPAPPPPRVTEPAAGPLTGTRITVTPLGTTRRDAVGLLATSLTGLPRDAFAGSDPARVRALIDRLAGDAMPAMQDLVLMLLLAELDPPRTAGDTDALFFARVDALLRFGALDQAQALMERAGATDPEAFRRWWDTSLLTGYDTRACDAMTANPGVAPTLPARIFCLSRTGDWAAAALTLETGRALGAISDEEDLLLANFLDPELFEGEPPPAAPRPMTPLAFRLLDGIGETPATRDLPLAFAVADLRDTSGWKQQIEAAERLVRARALDPNRLLALYTARRPAASGGVWNRAEAIQKLDAALLARDPAGVADALPTAVADLREIGLLAAFASLYGERLGQVALDGPAAELALRVGLLSPAYEAIAANGTPATPRDIFAAAIARGETGMIPPPGALNRAIADGLTEPPPAHLTRLVSQDRLGEALLESASMLAGGASSDPQDIADALAFFRANGLEDVTRRTALQLLLL